MRDMSERTQTDGGEQAAEQTHLENLRGRAEWDELGKIAVGVVAGLAVNAGIILALMGGHPADIGGGVMYLAPAAFIGAAIYHHSGGVDIPYVAGAVLFLTILVANSASLIIRMVQTGGLGGDPIVGAFVVSIVGLMFTPGAYIGVWAVRRWWL